MRARETADIIARAYGDIPIVERPELDYRNPPEAVLAWLAQCSAETVVAVGHEPQLSRLSGLLLSGEPRPPSCSAKRRGVFECPAAPPPERACCTGC